MSIDVRIRHMGWSYVMIISSIITTFVCLVEWNTMPWTLVSPSVTLSFPFPLQCDGNSLDNSDNYCTEWLFIVYNKLISDVIVIITINDVRGTKLGGTSHSGKACVHVCRGAVSRHRGAGGGGGTQRHGTRPGQGHERAVLGETARDTIDYELHEFH